MSNAQKYNQSLIPCTKPQQVLTESKESFTSFLKVFENAGGKVNDTTVRMIKESIDNHGYTARQVEGGIKSCFEEEQFFNWANVKKHIDNKINLYDNNKMRLYAPSN